jgi:hypothetical protein
MFFTTLLSLLACGPNPFDVAMEDGSIDTLRAFLVENPDHRLGYMAISAIEKRYGEIAQELNTVEAWDDYMSRYPEGEHVRDGRQIREVLMYDIAAAENTPESWQAFLDAYQYSTTPLKDRAEQRMAVAPFLGQLQFGEVSVSPVNLAENPEGPMNGYAVISDFHNTTGRTIDKLTIQVDFTSDNDGVIQSERWPLVADRNPDRTGRTELERTSIRNNEHRQFVFTIEPIGVSFNEGEPDMRWNRQAVVTPVFIVLAE